MPYARGNAAVFAPQSSTVQAKATAAFASPTAIHTGLIHSRHRSVDTPTPRRAPKTNEISAM
ncbi:hypothetical protein ACQP1G_12345 [Nocardia sp. CA-107356]|uniref:hypothetical protein n=1 Tax=Nocardia sp. CA-107356 TaxID=3239972 RepID=UPI003D94D971